MHGKGILGARLPPPELLDIGCGSGMQTIELARACPDCRIAAVGTPQPYRDDPARRAAAAGAGGRITTLRASMDGLPFGDASFDVLRAGSSIFVMGFEKGWNSWRRLLRPGGRLCLTEAVWFPDSPSPEAAAFWNECYPGMTTAAENRLTAERAGYEIVATFPLPRSAWREDYYTPLLERLPGLKAAAGGDPAAEAPVAFSEREIEMPRTHGSEYGCEFFVLRKNR
ncbi:MAG: class I SAM-dependent methyltransferase [Methanomicrobiales archaeon]|nr:class I SAM-dependent methyltransferase [Methanomicrobiales archaeon]MDI6877495.1 class I SAM-dependent methyltransferase [Methanomicrobiales archaeon]